MVAAPSNVEVVLAYAVPCAQGLLLLKIVGSRLFRPYRWFTAFLATELAQFGASLLFKVNTNAYGWVWVLTEPLLWVLHILIVLELYQRVLSGYKGISTLGRWVFMVAVVVAVTAALATLSPDLSNPSQKFRIILYYSVLKRAIFSSVAIFLLFITGFLVWYPIPLNRNVVIFAMVYAPYFLGNAAALLVRNVAGPDVTRAVSTAMLAIECACMFAWLVFLNRKGEARKVVMGHQWKAGDDERLVAQLNAVNRVLTRSKS